MANRIQIAHEAPLCLMPLIRHYTDYDYALVHLFEDSDKEFAEKYYKFFERSLNRGRRVILDNSVFELGTAFNMEKFFDWVYKLQPTEYIIPDVLEDCEQTLQRISDWFTLVRKKADEGKFLKSKSIGVCQGKDELELLKCYSVLSSVVDKIALSFDCSCYLKGHLNSPKWEGFMRGRIDFVSKLISKIKRGELKQMPLHLLGCALPQEYGAYGELGFSQYIETADTSNPVVHGLKKIPYSIKGLSEKCPTKLVEFMKLPSTEITDAQKATVFGNVGLFKIWL